MNKLKQVVVAVEVEFVKLFGEIPAVVKKYGAEGITVGNAIKKALASTDAAMVEAALQQMLPGSWEAEVIKDIELGLTVAMPELSELVATGGTVVDEAVQFVNWLRTLSPKMQHSGLLKLLSALFQALDPKITEVMADTAAQMIYAKSTIA